MLRDAFAVMRLPVSLYFTVYREFMRVLILIYSMKEGCLVGKDPCEDLT